MSPEPFSQVYFTLHCSKRLMCSSNCLEKHDTEDTAENTEDSSVVVYKSEIVTDTNNPEWKGFGCPNTIDEKYINEKGTSSNAHFTSRVYSPRLEYRRWDSQDLYRDEHPNSGVGIRCPITTGEDWFKRPVWRTIQKNYESKARWSQSQPLGTSFQCSSFRYEGRLFCFQGVMWLPSRQKPTCSFWWFPNNIEWYCKQWHLCSDT